MPKIEIVLVVEYWLAKGSANATDASYFVPLECLAAGWNGKDGDVWLCGVSSRRSICHAFEHREYVLGEYDV